METTQVKILEELTHDEERNRAQLELRVEQAFYQAGKALAELRERRLYRSTHKTFEAYCRDRFGFTRQAANYLIAGADIFENLTTIGCQILPTNERQVRSLSALEPEQQCQVWQQAVDLADGKVPSGRVVKGIVEQFKEKPLLPTNDVYQVGDIFILVRLKAKNKKYNGCWAVVVEIKELTVIVDVHNTTLVVEPNNLANIDSPEVKQQLLEMLFRIRRLREVGSLDRGAENILKDLGQQTNLTVMEKDLLSWLEKYYQVDE
ncbi:hypothetical protein H6G17_30380 [Chroococcidiopsis sp. FACHB-1243]|uniref:hypothetical protein n=1 Tax=Chroococcidiopsis sp. [FACHB-1243] TaxID=2692781 RepID=UPI001784E364|nr:hypothetical protein [Chroococcidiopsis sp. [FACHB-1243]]MBD2309728.1 hypothetical protein [Chroococcidiopsis sp. [FACHB-1243]]